VIQFASIILFHAALESCPIPNVKKKVQLLMDRLIVLQKDIFAVRNRTTPGVPWRIA
jgi:hypothetical protein